MKELLFKASALGINIRFYPVTVEEYEEWVNMQGKNRYILTLLGCKLTAETNRSSHRNISGTRFKY